MTIGNSVMNAYGTTIFTVMSQLAVAHKAINLGQGTPEGLEPPEIIAAAARAIERGPHQYPPMMGVPRLRQAIAEHAARFYDLSIDPDQEVMVTSGATEALADCLFGLIEPGDEVIVFEPTYDSYIPIIRRAGGVPVTIRLEPPNWDLSHELVEKAFSDRTKLILINTPQNPCGKVFTREELKILAKNIETHDAYAICDEVYEHLVFDGSVHQPLMAFPGMRERCIKIGSAGKIFSITNWKVGWIIADAALMAPIAKTHQFITFTTPTPLQEAVAEGLQFEDAYFQGLVLDLAQRRDRLVQGLSALGFKPLTCQGTYFLSADFSALGFPGQDADFCRSLVQEAGVAAVPLSAFYEAAPTGRTILPEGAGDAAAPPGQTIRFCFAKTAADIEEALSRLGGRFGC
ncbi:MAG: aminotransferase [Rhodospirillaceae bacterium]